jgi:hypothetical protein
MERWEPVPVPQGDGRHDIGDDVRVAIYHRLHDDFTRAAPWMTAEQRRQLAMLAAASVRALLHELGTLRDFAEPESPAAQLAATHAAIRALRDTWRKEADELDGATNGMWIEPSVKRNCADELEEAISATHVAVPRVAPSEETSGQ